MQSFNDPIDGTNAGSTGGSGSGSTGGGGTTGGGTGGLGGGTTGGTGGLGGTGGGTGGYGGSTGGGSTTGGTGGLGGGTTGGTGGLGGGTTGGGSGDLGGSTGGGTGGYGGSTGGGGTAGGGLGGGTTGGTGGYGGGTTGGSTGDLGGTGGGTGGYGGSTGGGTGGLGGGTTGGSTGDLGGTTGGGYGGSTGGTGGGYGGSTDAGAGGYSGSTGETGGAGDDFDLHEPVYRRHYTTVGTETAGTTGTYDEARTGYAAGHAAASNPAYADRPYEEVEVDVERNVGSERYGRVREFARHAYEWKGVIAGVALAAAGGYWASRKLAGAAAELSEEEERDCRTYYETHAVRSSGVPYSQARNVYVLGYVASRNPDYAGRGYEEVEPHLRGGYTGRRAGNYDALRDFGRRGYERGSTRGSV